MIIKSILDTDLYKFTTSYAYMKLFPNAIGTFQFVDRDNTEYTNEFVRELKMELCNMSRLALTLEESMFMSKCRFIPKMYWEWLSSFRFDPNVVSVCTDVLGHLHIEVTDHLYKATLYEVPILALVSELRNKMLGYTADNQTEYQLGFWTIHGGDFDPLQDLWKTEVYELDNDQIRSI